MMHFLKLFLHGFLEVPWIPINALTEGRSTLSSVNFMPKHILCTPKKNEFGESAAMSYLKNTSAISTSLSLIKYVYFLGQFVSGYINGSRVTMDWFSVSVCILVWQYFSPSLFMKFVKNIWCYITKTASKRLIEVLSKYGILFYVRIKATHRIVGK